MRLLDVFVFMLIAVVGPCAGQTIPGVKTKALDDSEVVLPKAGSQQVLVLILGFSRKGGDVCSAWSKRIAAEYGEDPGVAYYSLPVLEDAPALIRPMIVHGMKKGATAKEQAHMAPVYVGEAQWKKVVGYVSSDDAYLIVADAQSKVAWLGHGVFSEEKFGELKRAVDGLKGKAK